MKMDAVLQELETLATRLNVKVSYEVLVDTVGGGGLCKVKGSYRVIIEKRGTIGDKAVTLARALGTLEGVDAAATEVKLSETTAELLEKHRPPRRRENGGAATTQPPSS